MALFDIITKNMDNGLDTFVAYEDFVFKFGGNREILKKNIKGEIKMVVAGMQIVTNAFELGEEITSAEFDNFEHA